MGKRSIFACSLLAGASLTVASQALAQVAAVPEATTPGAAAESAPAYGEIIVTANRRAENIQKVPISISVLNNDNLAAAGVSSATQLQVTTTNLQISVLNAQPLIYIRGMGSSNLNAGSEGTVGLYLDGVYLPWSVAVDSSFLDVERVEVLKGPQGTLYGRNTTAGAINFITRDPSAKRAFETQATIGTWGTQRLQGYFSTGPGTFSASIAGQISRHNPYLRNLGAGPDYNERDEKSARGKLKWEMSDNWTATASVDYTYRRDTDGQGFVSYDDNTAAADPVNGGRYTTMDDPRHTWADFGSRGTKNRNFGAGLTIRGETPFADLVSITGYRKVQLWSSPDADVSDVPLTNFDALNVLKSWSQEFQIVSNANSDFDWIVGLYAFRSKGGLGPVGVYDVGNTGSPLGRFGSAGQYDNANIVLEGFGKAKAYAGYAQASYPIFDGFKVTGGVRYSWERRYLTAQRVSVPAFGNLVVIDTPPESKSWDSIDPKVGIEYSTGPHLLYATYSKGFRSGGYAIASPGAIGPVDPEKVDAYEVGGKHTIVPGLRFNWAGFYYKYKDLQVARESRTSTGSLFSLENASGAKIKGFEAELNLTAIENLSLTLGVGYTDAKFTEFESASAFVPAADTPIVPGAPNLNPNCPVGAGDGPFCTEYGYVQTSRDVSNRPLARAPKWTISGQATYTIPIGDGSVDLNGNVYYSTKYYLDTPSNIYQKSYTLVNANVTYNLPGDNVSVSVFANNLFNKTIVEAASTNAYTFIVQPNAPRIIGASVGLKY